MHTFGKLFVHVLELAGFAICAWGALKLVKDATVSPGGKKVTGKIKFGWNFIVHWIAGLLAVVGGLLLFSSALASYLSGRVDHFTAIVLMAISIAVIVGAIVLSAMAMADVVEDGKPDKRAVVCLLLLPTLLSLAVKLWPDSSAQVSKDGHTWTNTVQSHAGK
jgi:hypothetical protein